MFLYFEIVDLISVIFLHDLVTSYLRVLLVSWLKASTKQTVHLFKVVVKIIKKYGQPVMKNGGLFRCR